MSSVGHTRTALDALLEPTYEKVLRRASKDMPQRPRVFKELNQWWAEFDWHGSRKRVGLRSYWEAMKYLGIRPSQHWRLTLFNFNPKFTGHWNMSAQFVRHLMLSTDEMQQCMEIEELRRLYKA